MAFDPNNPPSLIASGIGGSRGLKAWAWRHTDPIADVIASGYIRTARKLGMGVGDAVRYVDGNDDAHHLVLASIDADTGYGTVAFPQTSEEAYEIDASPSGEIYVLAYVDGVPVRVAPEDLPDAPLTFASQAEAEAGVAEDKPMNALRTAQAIATQAATAAQGDLADTAVQPADIGTAAAEDVGAFATAAQGALADTALQEVPDGTVTWPKLSPELQSNMVFAETFGLAFDNNTASAAANSAAFQAAVDYLEGLGGGVLRFAGGGDDYCYLDAVPIVPARVSLQGNDGYGTRFRKFGATPSTETTSLVPRWGGGAIGYPIAVIQLGHIGGTNWSGNCEHISVFGNNLDLATTTTEFGFFVSGMSTGRMHRCTAEFVENGFFHGTGATIISEISECVTGNTLRGFYQEFATSTTYSNNYTNRARLEGYNLSSWYGEIVGNACDNMGFDATASDIPLAYWFHSCRGGSAHGNGAEYGKGSLWKITSSVDFAFHGNIAMLQTSIYTGGSDVVALELGGNNINLKVHDNQAALSLEVGATAARHFNWKASAAEYGEYIFARNRFYDDWSSSGDPVAGWDNTSGNLRTDHGTFTGTLTGVSGSVTGTFEWRCEGQIVFIDVPAIEGTSNSTACTLTGVPTSICPATGKTRYVKFDAKDNGGNYNGRALIQDNGTIVLQVGMSSTGFTASGTKGMYAGSLVYGR